MVILDGRKLPKTALRGFTVFAAGCGPPFGIFVCLTAVRVGKHNVSPVSVSSPAIAAIAGGGLYEGPSKPRIVCVPIVLRSVDPLSINSNYRPGPIDLHHY